MNMNIIRYHPQYAVQISELFTQAVHAIAPELYSKAQQKAWAPTPIDHHWWRDRLMISQPYLMLDDGVVLGFIELRNATKAENHLKVTNVGYIDCFYVRPFAQKQGIGNALIHYTLKQAKCSEYQYLTVEASLLAKPVFERHGFKLINTQQKIKNGMTYKNFIMLKPL